MLTLLPDMEGSGLVGSILLLHEDDIHRPGEGGGVDVPEVGDQPLQEVHGVQASLQQLSAHCPLLLLLCLSTT